MKRISLLVAGPADPRTRPFARPVRLLPLHLLPGLLAAVSLAAGDASPRTATTFEIQGHKAFVHEASKPAKGRPWVWYAPTLKGVSLVQRKAYAEAFWSAGIGIAGFDLGEVRGSPASTARFTLFYEEMVRRGWSAKPVLLGQSRGGLMLLAWAVAHPDKVRAFVGIYPVCNLASWPLQRSKDATLADFAMSEAELVASLDRHNPVDHLGGLLEHRVPVFIVHGDSDVVVPYADNSGLLKRRYEAGGGSVVVKLVPGEGHKVSPSFFECRELVEFVLANCAGNG